jgi:hypothetical protein
MWRFGSGWWEKVAGKNGLERIFRKNILYIKLVDTFASQANRLLAKGAFEPKASDFFGWSRFIFEFVLG